MNVEGGGRISIGTVFASFQLWKGAASSLPSVYLETLASVLWNVEVVCDSAHCPTNLLLRLAGFEDPTSASLGTVPPAVAHLYPSGRVTLLTSGSEHAAQCHAQMVTDAFSRAVQMTCVAMPLASHDGRPVAVTLHNFHINGINLYFNPTTPELDVSARGRTGIHLRLAHDRIVAGEGLDLVGLDASVRVMSDIHDKTLRVEIVLSASTPMPRKILVTIAHTGVAAAKRVQRVPDFVFACQYILGPLLRRCVRSA